MKSLKVWFVLMSIVSIALISCRSTRTESVELIRTVHVPEYKTDTVFVRQQGDRHVDTFYIEKERVRVRTVVAHDTVFQDVFLPAIHQLDTINVITPSVKSCKKRNPTHWVALGFLIGVILIPALSTWTKR